MRVVLEGVTGAGETSVIGAMREGGHLPPCLVTEDETFGDAMLEVGEPGFLRRLAAVCSRLDAKVPGRVLIERFHLSYYAQKPEWSPCQVFDDWLLERKFFLVVLAISEQRLRERSLMRREFGSTDWQGFVAHFGSEANAVEALRVSQDRRIEALHRSRVPSTVLNTDSESWFSIAEQITSFGAP